MNCVELAQELRGNTYPGRGIVLSKSEDGSKMVIAYFIMGRSENSRNRDLCGAGRRYSHRGF